MDNVVQLSQIRRRDTVTIHQIVTPGHHQGFGQDNSIKYRGTDAGPLGHKPLDVRGDLLPTRSSTIWAVNPYTQDTQRRVIGEDVGSVEAGCNIVMVTGGAVFQGTDHQDVSFVQVEFTPNSKTRIGHNLSYKTKVFRSGHEQVHVIGVHNQ